MVLVRAAPSAATAFAWATAVVALYAFLDFELVKVPFLPIASVGTAVAFYVGFKNNAAYDRFWEGRKIWGGIVNVSRTWANAVLAYVEGDDATKDRAALVLRHVAWVNALRIQLRSKSRYHQWRAKRRERWEWIKVVEAALRQDFDAEVGQFITPDELDEIKRHANRATHLVRLQGEHLQRLFEEQQLDLFKQIELMKLLEELYSLQGKCERIKATPFPRQYAYYARLFTWVFVAVLPCGLLEVFGEGISRDALLSGHVMPAITMVVSSTIVTWVFVTMEVVGDFSEDPFEGSVADVPMNALSRTIEIDLKQMIGDDSVPEPEAPLFDSTLY